MKMMKDLHKAGNAIILITHDNDVAKQAERRVHIVDGVIDSDSGREGALA